jgi:hypothetical protein
MTVAAGKTLSISDAVITGWGAGEIILGAGATLELSNVTIIMDGNYSTNLTGETIRVNGECTFITGSYVFDASTGSNEINGVTLWVDTLGRGRNSNVKFGSFTGTGRVSYQPETAWEPAYFDSAANYMTSSLLLHYDIDASVDTMGKNVFLLTDTEFTLQGGGRSMYMGNIPGSDATATKLLTVVGSNTMEIQDTSFVGWNEAHISDGSNLIRYGNGCVIRLLSDQTLTSNIYVSNATSGDTVTVDLNGHELIMDSDSSAFNIANTDVNLIIKNGRIMKLNDNGSTTKFLLNSGTSSTVTFQDVEMVLNGATRMLGNNVTFKGKCKITGTGDNTLSFYGTSVTIAAGAHLTFDKGMTLKLEDTSPTITFGSASSTLELFGATFDVSALASAPTFTTGTLLIDDKVTLAGDMTLGGSGASDLDIILQPAASLEITSGTITYGNSS